MITHILFLAALAMAPVVLVGLWLGTYCLRNDRPLRALVHAGVATTADILSFLIYYHLRFTMSGASIEAVLRYVNGGILSILAVYAIGLIASVTLGVVALTTALRGTR